MELKYLGKQEKTLIFNIIWLNVQAKLYLKYVYSVFFCWTYTKQHFGQFLKIDNFPFFFLQIFYVPLAFAVPPSIFWVHVQFNLLYQFWIHTEIVRSLGPLEYIFNTPSHHRVHHGNLNKLCLIGQKLRAETKFINLTGCFCIYLYFLLFVCLVIF